MALTTPLAGDGAMRCALNGAPRIRPHRGAPSLVCQRRMLAHLAQQRVLRAWADPAREALG